MMEGPAVPYRQPPPPPAAARPHIEVDLDLKHTSGNGHLPPPPQGGRPPPPTPNAPPGQSGPPSQAPARQVPVRRGDTDSAKAPASSRKRPVITVLGARPINEVGFRDALAKPPTSSNPPPASANPSRPEITIISARPMAENSRGTGASVGVAPAVTRRSREAVGGSIGPSQGPTRPSGPPRPARPRSMVADTDAGKTHEEASFNADKPVPPKPAKRAARPLSMFAQLPSSLQPAHQVTDDGFEDDVFRGSPSSKEPANTGSLIDWDTDVVSPAGTPQNSDRRSQYGSHGGVQVLPAPPRRANVEAEGQHVPQPRPSPSLHVPARPTPATSTNSTHESTPHEASIQGLPADVGKSSFHALLNQRLQQGPPKPPHTTSRDTEHNEHSNRAADPDGTADGLKVDRSKPAPATKPKPKLLPKPGLKPKPTTKPKPSVSPPKEMFHQDCEVKRADTSDKADLEDSIKTSASGPMKATYRPTIIRAPRTTMSTSHSESEGLAGKSVYSLTSSATVRTESDENSGETNCEPAVKARKRPTVIRPKSMIVSSALSMPNLAQSMDDMALRSPPAQGTPPKPVPHSRPPQKVVQEIAPSSRPIATKHTPTPRATEVKVSDKGKEENKHKVMTEKNARDAMALSQVASGKKKMTFSNMKQAASLSQVAAKNVKVSHIKQSVTVVHSVTKLHEDPSAENMQKTSKATHELTKDMKGPSRGDMIQAASIAYKVSGAEESMGAREVSNTRPVEDQPSGIRHERTSTDHRGGRSEQVKKRPPRPMNGPPPPRPAIAPTKQSTQAKSPSEPPQLPGRPGPGHPLHHYMRTDGPHAIVLYDYEASQHDELPLRAGDTVELVRYDGEWLVGRVHDKEGMFPASFVDVRIPPTESVPDTQVSSHEPRATPHDLHQVTGPRCQARFDYEGGEEEDLTFMAGDVISLIEWVSEDWLRGQVRGQTGIFPIGFVEIIEDLPIPEALSRLPQDAGDVALTTQEFFGEKNELSFTAGAPIKLLGRVDSEWLYGEMYGEKGRFPAACVQDIPADLPPYHDDTMSSVASTRSHDTEITKGPHCVATYSYNSGDPSDLTFTEGDIIQLLGHEGDEWLKGSLNGHVGIFPNAFVDIIKDNEDEGLPPRPSVIPHPTPPEPPPQLVATAIYDYLGESHEDLSFSVGQKIVVLEEVDGSWMKGRIGDQEGMFPSAFVELSH